ncbi:MAG: ABC transporter permease [Firmicutes bacterium]|nr:ABC transporter permease [Bacillota bacterium]
MRTRSSLKNTLTLRNILQNPSFPSFLILIVIVILNASLQFNFFTYRAIKSNLLTFSPLILASIAQGLVILGGCVDLSVGASISLLTVLMASMMGDSPGSIFFTVLCAIGLSLLISFINGFIISYFGPPPLLTTYATSVLWFGIALYFMPTPGGYIPSSFGKIYRTDLLPQFPAAFLFLIGAFAFLFIISRLRFYKHLYAVGGNEDAAYANGVNVFWTKIKVFLLSGIFVALAAICVVAQTATGDARSGLGYTLNSVAAAIIGGLSFSGGKGSIAGPIMGALILGLLINVLYFANITSFYQEFMKGIIIIFSLAVAAIPKYIRARSAA